MDIARICDGKRGHENQSLGLVEALARITAVRVQDIPLRGSGLGTAVGLVGRRLRPLQLVVGAGHGTHLPLLLVARRTGARSVVLMNPSLPRALFDLCVVPEHDGVKPGRGLFLSLGALNRVRPASQQQRDGCLILIGGPSRHSGWDDEALTHQLQLLLERTRQRVQVVTSRRTPDTTLRRLQRLNRPLLPFETTDPDWLARALPGADTVWVTEDSVSMAYEAASAGSLLGLLQVPEFRPGRTQRALQALLDSGRAVSFQHWRAGRPLHRTETPLAEADRCAAEILRRWPELA